ncbi:hypothetical protein CC85DRAFT_90012 [Cutaneotrichosporon oleaginosum]|uniref:N-acetyltransferase ESCO acetyl-transferase domain-containing protein n=1 Tax=Cutaneotrichosporon oleaginosum TaxID=879819 RepID=A0A0J0XY39_9TREE|nr:uncharacterized protein CC85DRAFT_90012 [Cutaneotrichosporon oleaginosum]KLT45960.1 hypothetical protein CC85DRAFT_90012 [Cutaneotrichosporon oleaginosum]TXT06655.1 hypothetical protein COLE_05986 [Cutaneotrichosporon oleaginosum]
MLQPAKPPVRRTYGRRSAPSPPRTSMLFTPPPSSPSLSSHEEPLSPSRATLLSSSPTPLKRILDSDPIEPPLKRARPLSCVDSNLPSGHVSKQATLASFFGPIRRRRGPLSPSPSSSPATKLKFKPKPTPDVKPKLAQLHFMNGAQRTCAECGMSYVRGGEDDRTHAHHHARVTRGIPFPKSRAGVDAGAVSWSGGSARLLVTDGRWEDVHSTVDGVLSASPLTPKMRDACKLVLATTTSPPPNAKRGVKVDRERIVGVVVAQPIETAMRVLHSGEDVKDSVDSGGGVVCDPTPLPTPLGIHRLFVVPAYRRCGLARAMLDAAASHTVYGCRFDPTAGEVAFSQPTDSGRAVMQAWGKGAVRVFDESQL